MPERLPDNSTSSRQPRMGPDAVGGWLAGLYDSFGANLIHSIGTGDTIEIDGVEFVCGSARSPRPTASTS